MTKEKLFSKLFSLSSLKFLVVFLIPVILICLVTPQVDNDSWFVLAEGRELFDHGIYHTDTLSMHDNLEITVQNYGYALFYYILYSLTGVTGLYISTFILNFLLCFLLYKLYKFLTSDRTNLSLALMLLTDSLLAILGFLVTRAQVVSYLFFVSLIFILEYYLKTGKKKPLLLIPIISLVQINLHASLWLPLFLIFGVYIIEARLKNLNTKPLIVVFLLSFFIGFLNPYGYKMITFVIGSYTSISNDAFVTEMQSFSPSNLHTAIFYCALVGSLLLTIFAPKNKKPELRHILLFFGFLILALHTYKAISQFVLVMPLIFAPQYKSLKLPPLLSPKQTRPLLLFSSVISVFLSIFFLSKTLRNLLPYPSVPEYEIFNTLDASVADSGLEKQSIKLFTGYNTGGYAEFRGYKPYLDPRAEVFLEVNNKKEDILIEYKEVLHGQRNIDEFLKKYDFDYLFVSDFSTLFLENSQKISSYDKLLELEDTHAVLYKKRP